MVQRNTEATRPTNGAGLNGDARSRALPSDSAELTRLVVTTMMDVLGEVLARLPDAQARPNRLEPAPAPSPIPAPAPELAAAPQHHDDGLSWAAVSPLPPNGSAAAAPIENPKPAAKTAVAAPRFSDAQLEELVIDTLGRITRYPRDLLTLESDLEDDLGIDSVKQAEILAALQQGLQLPEDLEVEPRDIRLISDIVRFARQLLDEVGEAAPVAASAPIPASPAPAAPIATNGELHTSPPARPFSMPAAPAQRGENDPFRFPGPGLVSGVPRQSIPAASWTEACPLPDEQRPEPVPYLPPGHRPFAGKVALVTGSGHGLGRSTAMRLAELGARVIINSFHSRDRGEATAAEINDKGGEAVHLWGSVANSKQLKAIFAAIEERFGYLDIFVSNAANGIVAPLHLVTPEHWNKAFQTNIFGLHQGAFLALPLMRRRGGGKILTISSPGAHRYIEHFGCLGPVKAALESLTRYLAIELGPFNVQVNSISAGAIYGDLLDKYPDGDRLVPYWESVSLGNELGHEHEVADFIAHMLSPFADKITGAVILADRGGTQRV